VIPPEEAAKLRAESGHYIEIAERGNAKDLGISLEEYRRQNGREEIVEEPCEGNVGRGGRASRGNGRGSGRGRGRGRGGANATDPDVVLTLPRPTTQAMPAASVSGAARGTRRRASVATPDAAEASAAPSALSSRKRLPRIPQPPASTDPPQPSAPPSMFPFFYSRECL
jgi:hypothetical protein